MINGIVEKMMENFHNSFPEYHHFYPKIFSRYFLRLTKKKSTAFSQIFIRQTTTTSLSGRFTFVLKQ